MQIQHVLLLSGVCFLSSCNSFTKPEQASSVYTEPGAAPLALDLVSPDFVNALRQLPAVPPDNTTVALLQTSFDDVFVQSMYRTLKQSGYGIRWVDDGNAPFLLQYRKDTEARNKLTVRDVYEVAVGFVEMRRTYLTDAGNQIRPVTPLYVRGTDASNIVLNDDIFNVAVAKPVAYPDQKQNDQIMPVPDKPTVTRIPTVTDQAASQSSESSVQLRSDRSLPREANPLSGLVSTSAGGLGLPLVALPRIENVFELGGSNFEDILAGHDVVVEQVLTFPNDSLRLGAVNKALIEQMVDRFDVNQDLFSVIGCSLGPTQVSGGNAALALGRASRVVEALLFSGVPQDSILDEGCWAGHSADRSMPRRGVVLTLNRKLY